MRYSFLFLLSQLQNAGGLRGNATLSPLSICSSKVTKSGAAACRSHVFQGAVFFALLLGGCATTPASQDASLPRASVALEKMDTQFLYLAAQRATMQDQPLLAARFLQALVKKDAYATTPRLELVGLLLATRRKEQVQKAQQLLQSIPAEVMRGFTAVEQVDFKLLYARTLLLNHELKQAIVLLNALLLAQPEYLPVRQLLIRANIQQGSLKQAHKLIRQGLKQTEHLSLRRMQVKLYIQQKELRKVELSLLAMQKLYPLHEDIVLQRSLLAEQQKQSKKAARLLKEFIGKNPQTAMQSYRSLANLYVRQQQFEAAIEVYQKLLPFTVDIGYVYMAMGKIYYEQKQYQQAEQSFAQVIASFSPSAVSHITEPLAAAYFYRAVSLEADEQAQRAAPYYAKLQPSHRFYLDAQLRLSSIDLSRKKLKKAEQRLQQLSKLFAEEMRVYDALSHVYLVQKAYEKLLKTSEKVVQQGFSPTILFNRAVALDALKRFTQLDKTLNTLLEKVPEHSDALNFYAYSLAERGVRLAAAKNMVQHALKLKANDGYYLDSLAWVYFKQQQYDQAVQTQLQAVAIIDDDPTMQDHLGDMFWHQGEAEQARMAWEKAIELKHESSKRIRLKIKHGLL